MDPVAEMRADPQYAAYFYNNSRLDPRLPPPIYSPGQSWHVWSGPAGMHGASDFDGMVQMTSNRSRPGSGAQPTSERRISPPGSPGKRKNLVDMIQEVCAQSP